MADKFYESKSHEGDDSSMNSSSSSSSSSSNSSSSSSSSDNDSDEEEFYDEKNERIVKVEMPDAGTRPQVDGIFHKKPKIKEVK